MSDAAPTTPLRAWLAQAWNDHGNAPGRLATEIESRAKDLPDDADGADAVRFAEHLLLAHRADPAALRRWLDALPKAAPALQPGVERARWALAMVDGSDGEVPPLADDAQAWRALHAVVMCDARRGRVARARERLLADEAAAASHPDAAARRAYAASANNVAGDLRDGPRGDAEVDALMLAAAALARRAWALAGGWINVERADHQLAMCHAAAGDGSAARAAADACLALCLAENADAVERFFAHECMVHALRADGDTDAAARHVQHMRGLLQDIGEAEMRDWCAQTLSTLDR